MTDPAPVTREQAAGCLAKICDDWLRRLVRDGQPPPGPLVLAALASVARAAPRVAAGCPRLLWAIGPRAACDVKAQAIAEAASEAAPGVACPSGWITTAQAAAALGLRADSVRWLLRRGRLGGRRTERGWQVDAASVRRRHDRPAA